MHTEEFFFQSLLHYSYIQSAVPCFNREIVEVYSGVLPELHAQSECRCPPSHPRVHPLVERYIITEFNIFLCICIDMYWYTKNIFIVNRYCIPSGVEDTTNDRVLRLNLNAHPLSYINDQDLGTTWLSKIMTTQELDEGVTITVDLANGQYQVTHLIIHTRNQAHIHIFQNNDGWINRSVIKLTKYMKCSLIRVQFKQPFLILCCIFVQILLLFFWSAVILNRQRWIEKYFFYPQGKFAHRLRCGDWADWTNWIYH